ncbi:hypothetical protein SLS59_004098 [Nothophoma quercina]|uniref:Uncharacterized protein n=1 Tax=Nothophoma quercina TaxID=749835 RepID=A0ABR3RK97_9PLEO
MPVAERQQERKPGWTHPLPGDPPLPLEAVNSGRRKAASDTEDKDEEAEQRVQHLRRAEMIGKVEAIVEQSRGMTPERRLVFAANVEKMKMKRSPYVRQLEAVRRKFGRALHEENAKDLLKASTVSEGMAPAGNAVVVTTVPVIAEKSEVKTSTVSNLETSASPAQLESNSDSPKLLEETKSFYKAAGNQTIRRTVVKAATAEPRQASKETDEQWDNVNLSDDEDWEKVVDDSAEWEVLEK